MISTFDQELSVDVDILSSAVYTFITLEVP